MQAILAKPVRDSLGYWHKRYETITTREFIARALSDGDSRAIVKVAFADGSTGVVFVEELLDQ